MAILPAEFLSRIQTIAHYDPSNEDWMDRYGDPSQEHEDADDLMCEILQSLGYSEGVQIFKDMTRWYA